MSGSYIGSLSLQAVYFLCLARLLGAAEMGLFSAVLAAATVAAYLSGLGSGNVLVMRVARDPSSFSRQYAASLVWILCLGSGIILLSGGIAAAVLPQKLGLVLALFLSECIFTRLIDVGLQAFQAFDRLTVTASINVAAAFVRAATVVALTVLNVSLTAVGWASCYVIIQAALAAAGTTICILLLGRPVLDRATVSAVPREGVWFVLGQTSRAIYSDLDKTLLAVFTSGAIAGNYTVAYRLIAFAFAPLQALVYSSNTKLYRLGAHGYAASAAFIRKVLIVVGVFGTAATAALVSLSWLPELILGDTYSAVQPMLIWLSPLLLIQGVHYALGDALMGLGRQSARALMQLFSAVVAVLLYVALIPSLGWEGAVIGTWVSEGLLAIGCGYVFGRGVRRALPAQPLSP
jgi:O-antigen/teichoic acid export membrane protein